MNQTKTLLLTSEFPPLPGGIGNHAYHLANELQGRGFDVKTVCDNRLTTGEVEKEFDRRQSFKVVRIPRKKLLLFSYLNRIKTAFLLTKNSELILCSGKFSLWLGAFLSLFFKKKFIAVIHGSEVRLSIRILRKLTDVSLKRFDKVIAVSNYTKSLVSKLGLKHIEVIPNGFEMKLSKDIQSKNNLPPVLITLGNLTRRKGQHNVISALPLLLEKYPNLKYHLVGIPTERDHLEQLAKDLNVEQAVVFFGKVSETEKMELLQQATIFVMLSEHTPSGDVEGFGIAILEANALGIPAIGALGCGIEDAINDGVSGRLINHNDPEAFLLALEEIIDNYEDYSQEAKNWSEHFKWNEIILKYIQAINNSA